VEQRRFEGHVTAVIGVAFAAGGRQVLSAGSQYQTVDQTFRVWDAESGRELHRFGGLAGRVGCVAFSTDGTAILSGGPDAVLRFWPLSK
jgi:WD40 repeat protein